MFKIKLNNIISFLRKLLTEDLLDVVRMRMQNYNVAADSYTKVPIVLLHYMRPRQTKELTKKRTT